MSSFLPDDYEELNRRFFKKLRESGASFADPSSWMHTVLEGRDILPTFTAAKNGIEKYYSDENGALKHFKDKIIGFLSEWDSCDFDYDNLTLCNSVTNGIAIVLAAIKKLGIANIFFETPVYFAGVCQARAFEFNVHLIPTYFDNGFSLPLAATNIKPQSSPWALWLSQPRTYLGMDQNEGRIREIICSVPKNCFLVIDEAMEQLWPSQLAKIKIDQQNIIKIRSLTKGIGLNGLRIACILHGKEIRSELVSAMENFQGGMDYQSLTMAVDLIGDTSRFQRLLAAARNQVLELKRLARMEILGSPMILSDIHNGYIGSVALPRPASLEPGISFREYLIEHCVKHQCPVILGSSMYFAIHHNYEFIRITYFNEPRFVINGLKILRLLYEV
jgi:histidinol-phosphate/aromatic aminotransferase/cobyric acid decarboxylase-like protein